MRPKTAIGGALICAAATAAALTLPASALPARSTFGVYVPKCNKLTRTAAFVGKMRAIKETDRMWMRFTLLERILPGKEFEPVPVPALELWRKSRPGVQRFSFRQRVRALAKAALYRMEVEFRWYDADGELLQQAFKRSRRCRQPGALPNLIVDRVRIRQGRYRAVVANIGRGVATGAALQLFVDGKEVGVASLSDIPRGRRAVAILDGPMCDGSVQAVVDPLALVRESVEDDNALTVPCAELRDSL